MERSRFTPLWKLCFAASLFGWLPVLFTRSIAHGGSVFDVLLLWTGLVLGGYGTIELFRVTSNRWVKLILASGLFRMLCSWIRIVLCCPLSS